jgi:hypothetical protein
VGKSGWPIFRKAEAVNTRGITANTPAYSSMLGLFYNPALLGSKYQREVFLISESGFAGDRLGGLIYGEPTKKGMISGGIIGYDAGTIELNWMENGELMSQNASAQRDLMGILSYGYRYRPNLYLGASVKAATSNIAERASANAFAADLGALYLPSDKTYVSASVQNLGTSTKFINEENPLPTSGYLGGGYTAKIKDYKLLTGAGVTYNFVDQKAIPEVGVEMRYSFISMSLGYRFNMEESVMQMGLGINWNNIEFGYAYVPGIYLDSTHRVNVSYRFTDPFSKDEAKNKAAVKTASTTPLSTGKTSLTSTAPAAATPTTTSKTTPTKTITAPKTTSTSTILKKATTK